MSNIRSCPGVSAWALNSITNIDAAVDHLKEHIRAIHSQRNILATINARLPREVLCEIFLCLARHVWASYEEKRYGRSPYRWLVVTFVCRYWRDLAQNLAELWTYNTFSQRRLGRFKEFIRLSKQRPLTIHCSSSHKDNLDVVLNEIYRIRSLEIFPGSRDQRMEVQRSLSNAPLLQKLYLGSSYESKTGQQVGAPVGPSFTPVLRELRLDRATDHILQTFVCPQLTKLQFGVPSEARTSLEALRGFPLLEELTITWAHGSLLAAELTAERIPLLHLRNISLSQAHGWRSCSHFFESVTLPSAIKINLWLRAIDTNPNDYAPFYQALASAHCNNIGESFQYPARCRMIKDTMWAEHHSQAIIWYEGPSLAVVARSTGSRLLPEDEDGQLRIEWRGTKHTMACLAFLSHASSSHLAALELRRFDVNRDGWKSMAALAGLRELKTDSFDIVSALQLLSPDNSAEQARHSSNKIPLSPNLETLILLDVDWRMHKTVKGRLPLERLRTLLQYRRKKGYPLRNLSLMDGLGMCPKKLEDMKSEETDLDAFSWTSRDKLHCRCSQ